MKSESAMARVTPGFPPLHANSGACSPPSRSTSWVRPDRIGPTGLAPLLWNTAAKRVPTSTISSNTMSAELSPLCGRATGLLSILTTSAGRSGGSCPYSSGWPVSVILGITASVVVVAGSVVVDSAVVVVASLVVVVLRVVVGASVVSGTVGAAVSSAASLSPLQAVASAARLPASSREASVLARRLVGRRDVEVGVIVLSTG